MFFINDIELMGDAIGSIPLMVELSQSEYPLFVASRNTQIYDMIPSRWGIKTIFDMHLIDMFLGSVRKTNLPEAFKFGNTLHMTQAHFAQFGLPVPEKPIAPELDLGPEPDDFREQCPCDFLIAPFSRSLPVEELWPLPNYHELAFRLGKSFTALGSYKYPHENISMFNVKYQGNSWINDFYDHPLKTVGHVMKKARYGLISVVTGPSHLAHALQVPNIQFTVQGPWGENPDATHIRPKTNDIRDVTVDEVEAIVRQRFNL